jgi:PKD repeat protein
MRSRSMRLAAVLAGAAAFLTAPVQADQGSTLRKLSPVALVQVRPQGKATGPRTSGESVQPERSERAGSLTLKGSGLDLEGTVSASWGGSGVRMQVQRIVNTTGSTSPSLLLRLWATTTKPVFGNSVTANVLGSYSLGQLQNGFEFDNVDTGFVAYSPPPDGCYYVSVALQSLNSSGSSYVYWSFATLQNSSGGELFSFGAGCSVTTAQPGVLYGNGNSSGAVLYRIDDYATNPHATVLGNTGLAFPAIAIDPTTGVLYAMDEGDGLLYQLDAQTARAILVGDTGVAGSGPVALAFDRSGGLFTWGLHDGYLYRLDKTNGAASFVGATGYAAGGDLAFDLDGTLFGSTGTDLIRIDPRNGASTHVGSFGTNGIYGLAVAGDGTLYAGQDASSFFGDAANIYRVNKATASLTQVGSLDQSLGDLALNGGGGSPPVAAFTWQPATPTVNQSVQFTDQSTGAPTSWQWDLDGDGATDSTAQNPTRSYGAAGTFAVKLTACNAAGCASTSQNLTVLSQPTLQIAGPASATALEARTFTATASGCTANPFGWSWTSDTGLLRYDGGLEPGIGTFPIASQTTSAEFGWTAQGTHTLHVSNTGCPGAQDGIATVAIGIPQSQATALIPDHIDKSMETIVFCHGLEPAGIDLSGHGLWSCVEHGQCTSSEVDHSVGDLLVGQGFNKVQFVWAGAGQGGLIPFAADYVKAYENTQDAGHQLATKLLAALGNNYNQPIQFVGHSLGSVVCGLGAVEFLQNEPKVTQVQLTVLDRPDHVDKLLDTSPFPNFESRFGFDSSYFPRLLRPAIRPGLEIRLDNYWSLSLGGVGDVTKCYPGLSVYNHRKPAGLIAPRAVGVTYFNDESFLGIVPNDHSGVQQWYRWTIDPNHISESIHEQDVCQGTTFTSPGGDQGQPLFNSSLSPCEAGWKATILGLNPGPFPVDTTCEIATVTDQPLAACLAVGTNCHDAGSRTKEPAAVLDASTAERTTKIAIDIPVYAASLLFTLAVTNPGDSASAVVLLDEIPLWSGTLSSFSTNRPVTIGPLSLYGLTGSHVLWLKVVGPAATTVTLNNLQVQKVLVPCDTADTLCVAAHRFRIEADWTDHQGNSGHASPRYVNSDASGFMWFFDQSNLELIVKVLNACSFAGSPRFWVFAAGLTDVEVRLTVTDTATGAVKIYTNPQSTPFQPIEDTDAFATCGPGDAVTARSRTTPPPAEPGPSTANQGLVQGRFNVTATWRTTQGTAGQGQFVPVTDNSGYFWFFDPGNIEATVKVLDGCGLNNRYWVFAAGLTDVQVDLTVTDSKTGAHVSYHNVLGQSFQPIQDTSAFATCP